MILWGLIWLVAAILSGLLIGKALRIADQRDAERRAAMHRHPSTRNRN